MQDRLFEECTFPRALPWQQFQRPLVLAPHPDDEVFGCGGLLALWAGVGVRAQVIVLTSGQAQGVGVQRQAESRTAAALLGHEISFWDLHDRGVRCSQALMQRLSQSIQTHAADLVLAPALHEPHPDHQATALAMLWSLALLPSPVDLCFYESGTALVHCTHLVDISSVEQRKHQAMQAFASQEDAQPYASRIAALNHFRALTLGPQAHAAEGFHWVNLAGSGWAAMLPALDPLFLHARDQAVIPTDLPLVSVLVPSLGSARLEQAVASVRAQSYPRIELRVAACIPEATSPVWWDALAPLIPAQWLDCDTPRTPAQASDAALRTANGSLCLWLDEQNSLAPGHIESLVHALRNTPGARAAHTPTIPGGVPPWQSVPPLPTHAMLFERSLFSAAAIDLHAALSVQDVWESVHSYARFATVMGSAITFAGASVPSNPSPPDAQIAQELVQIRAELHAIQASRAWRLVQRLRRFKTMFTKVPS